MTKMIEKKDCEYKGGYIVHEGQVVNVDNEIVDLFNKLEEDVQRAEFEAGEENIELKPKRKFARKTERGDVYPSIEADTPTIDKKIEEAKAIMDEIDATEVADKINRYFKSIHPLVLFVNDDFVIECEQGIQHRFDLPTIGNPLAIDKAKLGDIVVDMFA
jgi:hypothetical protein